MASIPDAEQAQVTITIPHPTFMKIVERNPMMTRANEPFAELGAGNFKIVFTSEEALGIKEN